ncbi:MAG: hypothetical protein WC708_07545 [Lentisphaeria bacterium]
MKPGFVLALLATMVGGALLLLPRAWGAAAGEGELPPGTALFLVNPNFFSESNIPLKDAPGQPDRPG